MFHELARQCCDLSFINVMARDILLEVKSVGFDLYDGYATTVIGS